MVGILKRLLLNVHFLPPKTHAHAHVHTHTYTETCRPLFEVSTQTIILTANLEAIKSMRLSSVLSQFSSLLRAAKSKISKSFPKVTGWLLGDFPVLPSTCLRKAGVLQWKSTVCSPPLLPEVPSLPTRSPSPGAAGRWSLFEMGSQDRKGTLVDNWGILNKVWTLVNSNMSKLSH